KLAYVGALITATIEERKVMLYTQKVRHSPEENEPNALHLWVTDNNRTFHFGPFSVDSAENKTFANTLLYSDGELYLLQQRGSTTSTAVSLARLTEELSKIKSVLSTWKKLDAFFSESSIPTAGLVGFLSDAASDDVTWIDEYRCLNASVTKAAKVENGFKFKGPGSGATWPVNSWLDNNQYGFVNHGFTLVAMVTIHQASKESTSLLGASLWEGQGTKIIGLSYGMNKTWETVVDGKTTAQDRTWELGREYQVALMLQGGNKGSVYVNGKLVGNLETIRTPEEQGVEISHFYIGGDEGDSGSDVTVKNVFLYNRPLSSTEMSALRDKFTILERGPEPQVGGASQLIGPAVSALSGLEETPADPMGPDTSRSRTEGGEAQGRTATTQDALTGKLPYAGSEGTAREAGDGGANGDSSSVYGSGMLLPLLLLLGLWEFAAP
ncbi:trans-sialidase, putative, partial [Trypanosoma cruzi marinkellei]